MSLRDRLAVVLVQLEIQLPVVIRVAEVCRELGLPLVLDPAPAQPLPDEIWPMVSVVKPNELEAEVLTGIAVDGRHHRRVGWALVPRARRTGCGDHDGRARSSGRRCNRGQDVSGIRGAAGRHHVGR